MRVAGDRVGKIVMSIRSMIDTLVAAATRTPFQTADLRQQPIMARHDNLAAVETWQQIPVKIALRLLAQFGADAVLDWLLDAFATVVDGNHFAHVVAIG